MVNWSPSRDGGSTGSTDGGFTCHSCKYKSADIWALLEHVFVAHGFRISDENLPNFSYPPPSRQAPSVGVIQAPASVKKASLSLCDLMNSRKLKRQQPPPNLPIEEDDSMEVVVNVVDDVDEVECRDEGAATANSNNISHFSSTLLESLKASVAAANSVPSASEARGRGNRKFILLDLDFGHHRKI